MDLLVTAEWLSKRLDRAGISVLDGTWCMAGEDAPLAGQFIPGAQFFDIDRIADLSSPMKHMLPSPTAFEQAMSEMGIRNDDHIIVYDRHGFRAAARLWWTFRAFGHKTVSILDGGLPAWIDGGFEVSSAPSEPTSRTPYAAPDHASNIVSKDQLIALLPTQPQIVDARSKGRFYGTEPEPRAGLRSGHIPGSLSLPFSTIRTEDGKLKDLGELADIVGRAGVNLSQPIITTCGSGITAAALAFVFHRLGAADVSVYDGSWTEWGASDAPIEI